MEQEHTRLIQELEHLASDLQPLGKLQSEQNNDSDNETASDNSEDSSDSEVEEDIQDPDPDVINM
jgi:hypothetical protein